MSSPTGSAAGLFCPTETAVTNLAREGIGEGVHAVGDVMYDATLMMRERARERIHDPGAT